MRLFLSLLFLLPVVLGLAQSSSSGFNITDIQAEGLPYRITSLTVEGISTDKDAPAYYYSFTHPGAGIQVVRGAMSTGGKDPVTVEALGKVMLDPDTGAPGTSAVQWVAPPGTGTNINIFANPVGGAESLVTDPLAKKGAVLSYNKYEDMTDDMVGGTFYKLPPYTPAAGEAMEMVESYVTTNIYVGMGGGIQSITYGNYTLRPEEKRGRSLLGDPNYKMKAGFAKGTAKKVFKDKDISFKILSAGSIPQISDPTTGNVVIFGGVKYKKDKSKKGSHFQEFFLMGSDKEGNLTGQEKIETEEPLVLKEVYSVGGKEIAPGIRQSGTAIFIAESGGEDENTTDPSLRYSFVVDINTTKIIARNKINLPEGKNVTVGTETDTDNNIVLLNYSVSTGQVTPLTLTKEGIKIGEPRFSGDLKILVDLPTKNLELRTISTITLADGRTMLLKQMANYTYDELKRVTGVKEQALLISYLSPDGKNLGTKALMKATNLVAIARKDDRILFSTGANFMELDLTDGSSKVARVPVQFPAGKMMFYSERFSTFYALLPTEGSSILQLLTYRFE